MSKTVYISESQYKKLKKFISEGENNTLNITVNPEQGQSTEDAIETTKDNIEQVAGSQVADNTNFTIKGNALEGKKFSKKQIEESRINKIVKEGKVFSKKDFTKYILGNE